MNEIDPSKHQHVKVSLFLFWMGFSLLLLDQLTKGLTYHYLPIINSSFYTYPYGGIGVFKNFFGIEFSINHMTNQGAAWGILAHYQKELIALRGVLIVGLIVFLVRFNREPSWQLPFVLIIAGAIGNVLDFFIYGHVIDMFHLVLWGYDFPVFNLADAAISIGIGLLFLMSLMKRSA